MQRRSNPRRSLTDWCGRTTDGQDEQEDGGCTRKKAAPSTGLSLHVGLNSVDPAHYAGWSGPLNACEADANDMAAVAKKGGIKPTVLLTKKGTRATVLAGIRAAAKQLKRGDFFLLTYSGHGGQVADVTGDEDDHQDETWCLYDGELIDDELYVELSRFATGVRVLVLSDSCHSGTATRARPEPPPPGTRSKMMPPDIAAQTYRAEQGVLRHACRRTSSRRPAGPCPTRTRCSRWWPPIPA